MSDAYLLFAMIFAGPGVSAVPVFVDRYPSRELCDEAGKDIRLTMPPSDKVMYWSMCVRAGTTHAVEPAPAPVVAEPKKEPEPPPKQVRKGWW